MKTPRDEFQHQLSVLRGGILEYARSPSAVFPSLQFFGNFKRDDARLTAEISAARDRISKAPAAHDAYSTARQRFDAKKAEHEAAQKALKGLYKSLGAATIAAFTAGEIPRKQQFAERISLDERIARLKSDQNALGVSPDSGIIVKVKAKAQQLAVAARITFARLSARKMEGPIGKALIDAQSEDAVRSASTAEVLDDVASARRDVASCKRDFDLAANALESAKTALSQSLGVSNIGTDAEFEKRLASLRWELTAAELRLRDSENKLLDSLVNNAAGFVETPVGPPLTRLAQLRAEAPAVEAQAALANESTSICSDPNSAEFRDPKLLGTPQAPTAVSPQLQRASSLREGFARDREILPQLLGNLNVGDTDNLRSLWDTLSLPTRRVAVFGLLALIAVTITVIGRMTHEGHTDPGVVSDFANGLMALVFAITGLALWIAAIAIYFVPSIVATKRKHPNRVEIFLVNLFLGWTVLGWIVALVWAERAIKRPIERPPHHTLAACAGAAVVLALLTYFCFPVLRDRIDDWAHDRVRDANGVTYFAGAIPNPVVFDVDGVRIGDSLEKSKPHFELLPEAAGKTTGLLGRRTIDFDNGTSHEKITIDFYFKDSKVIAFGLNFPTDCFEALRWSYNKKLGAIHYKMRFEDKAVTFPDGSKVISECLTWKTTDGDFNLWSEGVPGTRYGDWADIHGWGELGYSEWKLAEFEQEIDGRAKEDNRIQSQIEGKL